MAAPAPITSSGPTQSHRSDTTSTVASSSAQPNSTKTSPVTTLAGVRSVMTHLDRSDADLGFHPDRSIDGGRLRPVRPQAVVDADPVDSDVAEPNPGIDVHLSAGGYDQHDLADADTDTQLTVERQHPARQVDGEGADAQRR